MHQLRGLRAGDVLVLERAFFVRRELADMQVGQNQRLVAGSTLNPPMRLDPTFIEICLWMRIRNIKSHSEHEDETAVMDVFGHEPFTS